MTVKYIHGHGQYNREGGEGRNTRTAETVARAVVLAVKVCAAVNPAFIRAGEGHGVYVLCERKLQEGGRRLWGETVVRDVDAANGPNGRIKIIAQRTST